MRWERPDPEGIKLANSSSKAVFSLPEQNRCDKRKEFRSTDRCKGLKSHANLEPTTPRVYPGAVHVAFGLLLALSTFAPPQTGATKGRLPVAASFAPGTETVIVQLHIDLSSRGLSAPQQAAMARRLAHAHFRTRPIFAGGIGRAVLRDELLSLQVEAPANQLLATLKAFNALLAFRLKLDAPPPSVSLEGDPATGPAPATPPIRDLIASTVTQRNVAFTLRTPLPGPRALAIAYRALPTRLVPGAVPPPQPLGDLFRPLPEGPARIRTIAESWLAADLVDADVRLGAQAVIVTGRPRFANQSAEARHRDVLIAKKRAAAAAPGPDDVFEAVARAQNGLAQRWRQPIDQGRDMARGWWCCQDMALWQRIDEVWPTLSPEDVRRGADMLTEAPR